MIHQIILKDFLIHWIIFFEKSHIFVTIIIRDMARNVIYLERNNTFGFYGSPASLYAFHNEEELGVGIKSLNNVFCQLRKEGKPLQYKTKTGFTIVKGEIRLKKIEGKSRNYLGSKNSS